MTLEDYAAALRLDGYADATITAKVGTVRRVADAAGVEPDDLDRDDVQAYISARPDMADWTRIKYLSHLTAWCAWAGRPDIAAGIRRPPTPIGIPKPLGEAALAALLDAAPPRTRTWVTLGAYCGLRSMESARVAVEDLEQAGDGSWLLRVIGKRDQLGIVPAPPVVMESLRPWVNAAGSGRLWPTATPAIVQNAIRRAAERAGVDASSHRLRHRYGTAVYALDRDILVTQQLMRHRSPATTAGYALVGDDRRRSIVNRLPGAQGEPVRPGLRLIKGG